MEEFNTEFGHALAWLPWQRPGFELGTMLRRIVEETPGSAGVVLGGTGCLRGMTRSAIYRASRPAETPSSVRGAKAATRDDRREIAAAIMPYLRGAVSRKHRFIGSFTDSEQVLRFVNSERVKELAHLGTSCPDHVIRTKIRPMFLSWDPASSPNEISVPKALESRCCAAVDGWAVDYVRLDGQGRALADLFCYRNTRSIKAEESLHALIPARALHNRQPCRATRGARRSAPSCQRAQAERLCAAQHLSFL